MAERSTRLLRPSEAEIAREIAGSHATPMGASTKVAGVPFHPFGSYKACANSETHSPPTQVLALFSPKNRSVSEREAVLKNDEVASGESVNSAKSLVNPSGVNSALTQPPRVNSVKSAKSPTAPEPTTDDLEASLSRLEAAGILLAISEDGVLRIVQSEAEANTAVNDGLTIYTPRDAYYYVNLDQHSRRMLHEFKRRWPSTTEWRTE